MPLHCWEQSPLGSGLHSHCELQETIWKHEGNLSYRVTILFNLIVQILTHKYKEKSENGTCLKQFDEQWDLLHFMQKRGMGGL